MERLKIFSLHSYDVTEEIHERLNQIAEIRGIFEKNGGMKARRNGRASRIRDGAYGCAGCGWPRRLRKKQCN
jgi:hypothetical protein